ncbi:MAG: hypothetical protein H6617_08025 [Bdellovibrionaceae bacterium]|nr:hypothetical protein [Bdellovibrionales bacterium]MCB9254612.1 hypothetical protein [Pseudobdellovibrionaceae bacterium]
MKSVRFLLPLLVLPFLMACQEELPDRSSQRLNLIGDGSGTNTFMLGCLEQVTADVKAGKITQADLTQATNACRFDAKGVSSSVRQAGGARGFHSAWAAVSSWWNTGSWWPGYQENCEFNNGGYSCMNYDYYYPWYYTPSSLSAYYNIDFSLFCGVSSFSLLCNYFGYYGGYVNNCSKCQYYPTRRKRRRCLEINGCFATSVSTVSFDDTNED